MADIQDTEETEERIIAKFRYWRLIQLLIALLLALLLAKTIVQMNQGAQQFIQDQVENWIETHIALIAAPSGQMLKNSYSGKKKQKEQAKQQLQYLSQQLATRPEIIQVFFYNQRGEPAIEANQSVPLPSLLPIGEGNHTPPLQRGHQLYMHQLYDKENQLIGYLQLTLNRYLLSAALNTANRKQDQKVRVIILCSLLLGIFLTKAFSRKHSTRRR